MPVWLNTIPPAAPKVFRPNTRRWLVALLIILFMGFALTLWFWKTERTGFIFWFTAVGLPICSWGLVFGVRRMAYKMQQVSANVVDFVAISRKAAIAASVATSFDLVAKEESQTSPVGAQSSMHFLLDETKQRQEYIYWDD